MWGHRDIRSDEPVEGKSGCSCRVIPKHVQNIAAYPPANDWPSKDYRKCDLAREESIWCTVVNDNNRVTRSY
jgi:hypothetical protein